MILRILHDDNRDMVKRLVKITTKCRVVDSKKRSIVLGRPDHAHLLDRKDDQLDVSGNSKVDHVSIKH